MSDERDDDILDDDLREVSASLSALRYVPLPGRWEKAAAAWTPPAPRLALRLAIAAAALLLVGAVTMLRLEPSLPVVVLRDGGSRETRLTGSRWLETGAGEVATVMMADVGTVRVEPGSRLRLKASGATQQRLELERGELHAVVSAAPRLFVVDTPNATAVDLGCVYTLSVIDAERTVLTVEEGEVALEGEGRESRVLAGMRAVSRRGQRPGTPFALDAPEALQAALRAFDETGDPSALTAALDAVRPPDAPTLWHLLARVDGPQRAAVARRLAAFVPPPAGFTEGAGGGAAARSMQAWWSAIREAR